MKHVIEQDFPFEKIDAIAEIESYRKEINRPVYHIHKWWAKRLGSVFRSIVSGALTTDSWKGFYEYQQHNDKIVLDPFMGSGTTLGEAAKLGANIIGCDVNPVSTFLVTQALTNVEASSLEDEYKRIEQDVKEEILSFYKTIVPGSDSPTQALYYFWVKVVETPSGEEIPLFSSYVFSKNAYSKKKPESRIWCPSCESIFIERYDCKEAVCPSCSNKFNPQVGPAKGAKVTDSLGNEYKIKDLISRRETPPKHKLYAILALDKDENKVYVKPTQFDFDLLDLANQKLSEQENDLPLPTMSVRKGHNTDQARGYRYLEWRDFFNTRQLLCLGILLNRILKIQDKVIRDHFVCLFSGTLEFNNIFCSFKGEGTGAVRHMFSNHILKPERTPLENNVWGMPRKSSGTFSSLFKSRLLKAKAYLEEPFEILIDAKSTKRSSKRILCSDPIRLNIAQSWDSFSSREKSALILNGDSACLPIPDCTIDAVVTDPPYFDFVHYSELSDFFYAWLSPALGDDYTYLNRNDSSHSNEVQDKDNESFTTKIGSIFKECNRVLKEDGLMCFSYHHSTIDGWMAIYKAVTGAKFDIVAAHPVKAEMSVASPKSAAKEPINIDAILICKKRNEASLPIDSGEEVEKRFHAYIQRFINIGRALSAGDRFVIACSQATSIASIMRLGNDDAQHFIQAAVNECLKSEQASSFRGRVPSMRR